MTFRKYLERIDEASDYLVEELPRYLKHQGYKYQKIMLAEGKIGSEALNSGFQRDVSTDREESSEESEAAGEKIDKSRPASQKIEEPRVNRDLQQHSDCLASERNAAEIDANLAEAMSQTQ